MTVYDNRFYQVPNMIHGYGLSPCEFAVYCYLVCCAGKRGVCYPSIKTISGVCGCSENTARKAVHSLAEKKFIRIVETYAAFGHDRSRRTNNTYFILDLPALPRPTDTARKMRYKKPDGGFTENVEEIG